jgi:hypothetical protein
MDHGYFDWVLPSQGVVISKVPVPAPTRGLVMARDNDSDVDRAMAELPALSKLDHIATAAEPNRAVNQMAAFSLLIAALPDFDLSAVPPAPVARQAASDKSERPITTESSAAATPVKLSTLAPLSKNAAAVLKSTGPESLPFSLGREPLKRPLAQPTANGRADATSLMAVFRRLSAAGPLREDRPDPEPGLQSLFDLL